MCYTKAHTLGISLLCLEYHKFLHTSLRIKFSNFAPRSWLVPLRQYSFRNFLRFTPSDICLFCCYRYHPSCVISQQSWFGLFCFINFQWWWDSSKAGSGFFCFVIVFLSSGFLSRFNVGCMCLFIVFLFVFLFVFCLFFVCFLLLPLPQYSSSKFPSFYSPPPRSNPHARLSIDLGIRRLLQFGTNCNIQWARGGIILSSIWL